MAHAVQQPYPTIVLVLDYDEADLLKQLLLPLTNENNYVADHVYDALTQA